MILSVAGKKRVAGGWMETAPRLPSSSGVVDAVKRYLIWIWDPYPTEAVCKQPGPHESSSRAPFASEAVKANDGQNDWHTTIFNDMSLNV